MSNWYVIAGVAGLVYLMLVAWIVVEAIVAPLIDDPSATWQTKRHWWLPHVRGRHRGFGAGQGPTPGRPA